MTRTSISVVIATLDRPEPLQETLSTVAATEPLPDEVVVVDGGRNPTPVPAVETLRSRGVRVEVIHAGPGVSRQRNIGIDAASGEVVVFLDDDVMVGADFFRIVAEILSDRTLVAATGKIVEPQTRQLLLPESVLRKLIPGGGREGQFTRYGYPRYLRDPDRATDVEFMAGCLMCVRREAAASVGFDERLAIAEDEDFAYRLARLGRVRYDPRLTLYHRKLGFLLRDRRKFELRLLFSRRYIFRKNFPQTPLARAQFGAMILGLLVHRLANGELEGARGLLDAVVLALRRRLDDAAHRSSREAHP